MKKLSAIVIAAFTAIPTLALAATTGNFNNVFSATDTIMGLITRVIPLIIGAAVLMFLWGILRFVFAGGDEGKKQAKSFMVLGIIGLAVMVSVWGLVRFLQSTFGLENSATTPPPAPRIPTY